MSAPRSSPAATVVGPQDVDTLPDDRPPLSVHSFGLTDPGKVRATNEDQFLIAVLLKALQVQQTSLPHPTARHSNDRGYLFVVADGMGGHAGGDKASALAIDSVESFILETFKWFFQIKGKEEDKLLAEFRSAPWAMRITRVLAEAAEHPEAAWHGHHADTGVQPEQRTVCGSRRRRPLPPVPQPRSFLADVRSYPGGRDGPAWRSCTAEEATGHRWQHVITNAVGANATPRSGLRYIKVYLEAGDAMLLCSDGLTPEILPDRGNRPNPPDRKRGRACTAGSSSPTRQ